MDQFGDRFAVVDLRRPHFDTGFVFALHPLDIDVEMKFAHTGDDRLAGGLRAAGFDPMVGAGSYFITVDSNDVGHRDGMEFCRALPGLCGVVAVPSVVFYDNAEAGRSLVRFAFCKAESVLDEAAERLGGLQGANS